MIKPNSVYTNCIWKTHQRTQAAYIHTARQLFPFHSRHDMPASPDRFFVSRFRSPLARLTLCKPFIFLMTNQARGGDSPSLIGNGRTVRPLRNRCTGWLAMCPIRPCAQWEIRLVRFEVQTSGEVQACWKYQACWIYQACRIYQNVKSSTYARVII